MELETVLKGLKALNPASWTYADRWIWDYEWSQTLRAPYNDGEAIFNRYVTTPMAHTMEGISLRVVKDQTITFQIETQFPYGAKTQEERKLAKKLENEFAAIRAMVPPENMKSVR